MASKEGLTMNQPLEGVRVVEYGSGAGSAYCSALLGNLGAHVDKVVRTPPSDVTELARVRRLSEETFLDAEKSILVGEPEGAAFLDLVKKSQIVVRGHDPIDGEADLIRGEYESLREINPDLIFVALTPFGTFGPAASWHGGDLNAQAMSGWTWIVGLPDEAPLTMNYDMGAMQQGLVAAGATIAALLERGSSGAGGEFVDIAEADVIASCIRMYSMTYRALDITLTRNGHRAPGSSGRYPHTILPCKDGYISTMCRSAIDWSRFVEMLGNPSWTSEPRYQNFMLMGKDYPDEVDALIVPWLMQHTKSELGSLAVKFRVPLAPVFTIEEALGNDQFLYRGFLVDRQVDDRVIRVPGSVARWS